MSLEEFFELCASHDWDYKYASRNVYYSELAKSDTINANCNKSQAHQDIYQAFRTWKYPNQKPQLETFMEKVA